MPSLTQIKSHNLQLFDGFIQSHKLRKLTSTDNGLKE